MAKIFVSIPVLEKPELKMMNSLFQAISQCPEHTVIPFYNYNDSLISRVRNVHLSKFLNETDCDYFMSLDSDIEIINRFRNNNIFNKMIDSNMDFVGGLYALKTDHKIASSSISINSSSDFGFDSGLVEMKWLSSGCWCIKREKLLEFVDLYPELHYNGDDNASNKKIYGMYIPYIKVLYQNGTKYKKYLSEDWAFCQRWRDSGFKIYADTSIVLNHIGTKPYALWNVQIQKTT